MYQELQIFTSTVIATFLEASPFLMRGSILSAVFEIYVPADILARYLLKGRFAGVLFGLCTGMLIPTCECGVVSIVRRLPSKSGGAAGGGADIPYIFEIRNGEPYAY